MRNFTSRYLGSLLGGCGSRCRVGPAEVDEGKPSTTRSAARGSPHRVAVTAVARKLCHIIFAVMRRQAPYDPDR